MTRILVLGGTSEASALAHVLADRAVDAIYSYAGRTKVPAVQPLPTRIGGFGGEKGLSDYLKEGGFTHLIDATHPFAAQISRNAISACADLGVSLAAFQRPAWHAEPGDDWKSVPDLGAAVAALPQIPLRIFLAIGRQDVHLFARQPQHHYLLRLVDPPDKAMPLPTYETVVARGPFEVSGDKSLMRDHRIDLIVAKNAGGTGAAAKLVAARDLGLPVIMVDRPNLPPRTVLTRLEDVLNWLDHPARLGV